MTNAEQGILQPEAAESLGRALAARLRDLSIDAVVLWCDPRAAVLGHVVARELGAELVYAYSDLGILTLSSTPPPGTRAALLDYVWEPDPGLVPLLTMVRHSAEVAAVASVLSPPDSLRHNDIGPAVLISLEPTTTAAH
ncbi:hypothetical protein ACIP5Y_11620 [Nocardia sp. NPDC088792]|uniref:hypothetical protein n=1 Tax=Nocardia sp. NPDC088792 TaxID=3364332 RepID=UPI0038142ACD